MTRPNFAYLQQLGRALMLPIAVLPIAGLLLRLGQDDLLNISFVAAAGAAIFNNLGLLFAIGIAVGFAKENHGAAGLAGAVGYLVATEGAKALVVVPPGDLAGLAGPARELALAVATAKTMKMISVPAGILAGILAGTIYNRFKDIELPEYLAFFGGKRFVPIATGTACLGLAVLFGFGWPWLQQGLDGVSRSIAGAGDAGLFAYGLLNRLLIVTGLHHIINNFAWFLLGDYNGATGDLNRFFAGDPTAGGFMAGFFPVMMFGLPAACLAMYHTALPERKAAVGGLLLSMALTAFLTGITEPIEFSFMFLAPALYAVHAVLTGLALVVMNVLDVKLGFGFSAGLFDYVLNYGKARHPLLLLPVGAVYFALYYGLFRLVILRFGLKTLGREDAVPVAATTLPAGRGPAFVRALGGGGNLVSVDACTTRLRLVVADDRAIDEAAIRSLGARGLIRPAKGSVQIVLGPLAEIVADEMRRAIAAGPGAKLERPDAAAILAALGGAGNIRSVDRHGSRLRIALGDTAAIDEARLGVLGSRGVARPAPGLIHLLLAASDAEAVAAGLRG